MYSIKAHTIGEAWLKALGMLLNGPYAIISDDKGSILEIISVCIDISHPAITDAILKKYANKETLQFMEKNFRELDAVSNWGYSYGQRLYNNNGVSQIKAVVETLHANRFSKSATISLLDFNADQNHKPCLVSIDFKVRNNSLLVTGFFRSQDIGKKMYADAVELLHIGNKVASQIGIATTKLILFISSAHIYKDDYTHIRSILNNEGINLQNGDAFR